MARERVTRKDRSYLVVPVDPGRPFTDREKVGIQMLTAVTPEEDAVFEIQDDRLVCYLNALSPRALWDAMRDAGLLDEVPRENSASNPFLTLACTIESIGSYAAKGDRRIYIGYNDERKVGDRETKVKKRGRVFYARDHPFTQERNELPGEYLDQVLCGDAEELLKGLPDNCIDLVFTSPPYNFGLSYGSTGDEDAWEQYFEKLFAVLDECIRVLVYGGRIVVNVQPLFSDYIPSHHLVSQHLMKRHLIWKGEILWEKNNYNCKYTAWGSWKSPASPYLKYTWEFLEVFAKGDLKKEGRSDCADITADEFKEWVVAKWSIGPERRMKEFGHPAVFPESLATRVQKLFSFAGDVVLDPFNGVGTTTAVATRLRRRCLGIDIDPAYCETARQRMDTEKTALRKGWQSTLQETEVLLR